MTDRILFVDDEPNILDGIRRQLRRKYEVVTAVGPEEALKALEGEDAFAVIVSDMQMPIMNGAQLLGRAAKITPDTVQMILSGQAQLEATIAAVNNGNVFRFLTKPCSAETLTAALDAALKQHHLVISERVLLEETLTGAVQALTDVLALIHPDAMSRSSRLAHYALGAARNLGVKQPWRVRVAALLSQVGCVALPSELVTRAYAGEKLSPDEARMYLNHPTMATRMVGRIPRLEVVGGMIREHLREDLAEKLPLDSSEWTEEMMGAQILRCSFELDRSVVLGQDRAAIFRDLAQRFPDEVVEALKTVPPPHSAMESRLVGVDDLKIKMVLDQAVHTTTNMLLVQKGEEVTDPMLTRLQNFSSSCGVVEPFRVLVPTGVRKVPEGLAQGESALVGD